MTAESVSSPDAAAALRLRAHAFEHLAACVVVTTASGEVLDCNDCAERLFGCTHGEMLERNAASLADPEGAAAWTEALQAGVHGRWSGELSFQQKDGTSGIAEATISSVEEEGEPGFLLAVLRDVTRQRQAEGRLVEERNILRTLIDALPDMIFFKDCDGRYLLHNAANRRIFKVEGEDLVGKTVFDIPGLRDHAARYHSDDMTVIATGEPVTEREEPYTTPEGKAGWFLTSKYPLRNEQGETIGLVGIARDITSRKEAERTLADERQRLRTVIDAIPDPLFVKDTAGRHVLHNLANARAFSFNEERVFGATVYELPIPREHADRYAADDRFVMETGRPVINREEPYAATNGRNGWFLTSKFPLRDSAGEIIGLVGICRDITEMKAASSELAQTRQRLIDHVENSPLAIIEWRADGTVLRWSGQAEAIFGWEAAEVERGRMSYSDIVHPEDAERVAEVARRLQDGLDRRSVCQNRNLRKDGGVVHCLWQNSVLRNESGEVVTILSLVQDVTERVLAEQTIRENERLYHTMIEATNTGYVQFDKHGAVMDANPEYVRLTGRETLDEIRGARVTEWIALHDFERNVRALQSCLAAGSIRNLEIDYISPDGKFVPIEMNACVMHVGDEQRIIAFCRDITVRRNAEADRQDVERKLQEAQKLESLGVLAGGIAHDFNNLLTGVLGNANLASADLGPSSPVQPYLEQIEAAALRAADLCKQMLAYSGRGRFVVTQIDLNALVHETADLLQLSISKKATLVYQLAPRLPAVLADATQIRQILMNLVINASEALGDRAGRITLTTGVVRADAAYIQETHLSPDLPEGDYVYVEIADNGCGMPPEVQERIFDPFYSTKFTGRGLGLAAVLGIVRGHQGALKASSEPGRGSTFTMLFPRVQGPTEELMPAALATSDWRGEGTVLVVDDEAAVRGMTSRMLELLGFKSLLAADGRAGVELFLQHREEIVLTLLDLTMPEMDGHEVFCAIRAVHPDARIVLMSGFTEQQAVSGFVEGGLSGFLQKPFRVAEFRAKLQQILAS